MDYKQQYDFWRRSDYFDEGTKEELENIKDDDNEIKERFYKDMEFGTGGLRGIIGAGTNRMNIYTVRRASQGLANYVMSHGDEAAAKGIVIAYDVRRKSREFAENAARVFVANGIRTYLFEDIRPTPELSFAIRYLKTASGVVITASHNPKEYNGYKAYGNDGALLAIENSQRVTDEIEKLADVSDIKIVDLDEAFKQGMLQIIGLEIDNAYLDEVQKVSINKEMIKNNGDKLKIIYTPIHGTGNKLVRAILDRIGIKNVKVVKEQELPDSEFSTVKSPNPENLEAFTLAIRDAKEYGADIIIGTDPDSDRVAVLAKDKSGNFEHLSGNETGNLLLYYILSSRKENNDLPSNAFMVKTVVTTELSRTIANSFNVDVKEVLTGFKFIGEQIALFSDTGKQTFMIGFEESYGYLSGTQSRDKDGVVGAMLLSEAALYYKLKSMTLTDVIEEMYVKYGYRAEATYSYTLNGIEGAEKIKYAMEMMRKIPPEVIDGFKLLAVRDYESSLRTDVITGEMQAITLPVSNLLYFEIYGNTWFAVRPSGTEPKIRLYFEVCAKSREQADKDLAKLQKNVRNTIEKYLYQ